MKKLNKGQFLYVKSLIYNVFHVPSFLCIDNIPPPPLQGRIQGVFKAGIPVWVPKFGTQKIFSGHFIFNGVLCVNLFFNQIQSKGLKKMCDCTLKLRLVYIN